MCMGQKNVAVEAFFYNSFTPDNLIVYGKAKIWIIFFLFFTDRIKAQKFANKKTNIYLEG